MKFKAVIIALTMFGNWNSSAQDFFQSKSWVSLRIGTSSTRTTTLSTTDPLYFPPDLTVYGHSGSFRYGRVINRAWAAECYLEGNAIRWAIDYRSPFYLPPLEGRVPYGAQYNWYWKTFGVSLQYRKRLTRNLLMMGEAGPNLIDRSWPRESLLVWVGGYNFYSADRAASYGSRIAGGAHLGAGLELQLSKRFCLGLQYGAVSILTHRWMHCNTFGLTLDPQGRIQNDMITYDTRTRPLTHQFSLSTRLASRTRQKR